MKLKYVLSCFISSVFLFICLPGNAAPTITITPGSEITLEPDVVTNVRCVGSSDHDNYVTSRECQCMTASGDMWAADLILFTYKSNGETIQQTLGRYKGDHSVNESFKICNDARANEWAICKPNDNPQTLDSTASTDRE